MLVDGRIRIQKPQWLSKNQQKNDFFTFTSVLKNSKSFRSHTTVKTKVILNFLLVDGRIRIQEAQKLTDHTDSDTEHCLLRKSPSTELIVTTTPVLEVD